MGLDVLGFPALTGQMVKMRTTIAAAGEPVTSIHEASIHELVQYEPGVLRD